MDMNSRLKLGKHTFSRKWLIQECMFMFMWKKTEVYGAGIGSAGVELTDAELDQVAGGLASAGALVENGFSQGGNFFVESSQNVAFASIASNFNPLGGGVLFAQLTASAEVRV